MDELELLKKDWNKNRAEFKNYSDSDIYPMLHKKSSSIIKTLLYISVAELGFWILVNIYPYFSTSSYTNNMTESYDSPLFIGLSIFSFTVVLVFVYLLYTSYKSISTTDNAKKLMESILRTRKVIKYYVLYNLFMIFISVPITFYIEYTNNTKFHDMVESSSVNQMFVMACITLVVTSVFLGLFWLFYKLLYGILLKRLNKNYNELKKLEV